MTPRIGSGCWTYVIRAGTVIAPSGTTWPDIGYSGNGVWRDDPNSVFVHNHGPIPPGWYTIGDWMDRQHLGKMTAPLIPDKENEMFGRGGFFIHGDNISADHSASDGCCVLPPGLRQKIRDSEVTRWHVVPELLQ